MDPFLIIPSRYNCLDRFRWKHTPSDSQGIHHIQDVSMKPTVCLKVCSLWINHSSEIPKNFVSLLSNHYCQNFHKVLYLGQDQFPAYSGVFFAHTHYIYRYKNMKQIPLNSLPTGKWALSFFHSCMHSHRMMPTCQRPQERMTVQAIIYTCNTG